MYIPDAFAETDTERLHDLIEAYDFAMLITNAEPTPMVSHLPFVLDRTRGPNGTLQAHMARSNPHWRSLAGEALVVFRGPHRYVSPSWYEPGSPAVPTWNYAVVEAYGTPRIVDDPQELRAQQERLVAAHEAGRSPAWDMAGQPPAYIDGIAIATWSRSLRDPERCPCWRDAERETLGSSGPSSTSCPIPTPDSD